MVIAPRRRRLLSCLGATILLWFALAAQGYCNHALAEPSPSKQQLESAYLYNFLLFVHWPQEQQVMGQAALTICILGDEELAADFAPVAGKAIKETKYLLRIRTIRPPLQPTDLVGCSLLFIASPASEPLAEILAQVRDLPILTVSDRPDFANKGGMVALVEEKGKLRWRINQGAATQVGLRFEAQLLRNAAAVINTRPEGP